MRALKRLSFAKAVDNTNLEHGTIIRSCGLSSVDRQHARTGGRRVSRQKRYTMVEDFVERYKTENDGKFPSVTRTQEEVGGSYYIIKDLVRELQYKSRHLLLNQNAESDFGEPAQKSNSHQQEKQSPLLMDSKNVSTSKALPSSKEQFSGSEINLLQIRNTLVNHEFIHMEAVTTTGTSSPNGDHVNGTDRDKGVTTSVTSNDGEMLKSSEASYLEAVSTSGFVGTPSDHADTSGKENFSQKSSAELNANILDEMQRKNMHQHPSANVPKSTGHRDACESARSAEHQPKKQTLWSNLKSVADGILNFWKKL